MHNGDARRVEREKPHKTFEVMTATSKIKLRSQSHRPREAREHQKSE